MWPAARSAARELFMALASCQQPQIKIALGRDRIKSLSATTVRNPSGGFIAHKALGCGRALGLRAFWGLSLCTGAPEPTSHPLPEGNQEEFGGNEQPNFAAVTMS